MTIKTLIILTNFIIINCIVFVQPLRGQMVTGERIPEFGETFGVDVTQKNFDVSVQLIGSSVISNIYNPGETPRLTIQVSNNLEQKVTVRGVIEVIAYGTSGRPGNIWVPRMFKVANVETIPIELDIQPLGYSNLVIEPNIPDTYGAYAVVADLGEFKRQFITSLALTFPFESKSIQHPTFCLDRMHPDILSRLGTHAIRLLIGYKPTTDPDFEEWYQDVARRLREYHEANIAVLIKMGAGSPTGDYLPLGAIRPHLDEDGVMLNTKSDYAWLQSYDQDFRKLVYRLTQELGWPKGPINAFALWNEPWEGISISGWGADMIRYREIYTQMAQAVREACKEEGVDVLVGGCSSTSNALDKLFPDGPGTFLDDFDFCSIHYQGLSPYSTIKMWRNRQSPNGRVKIWDTESWVANTDDRVAAVVATNRAAGYDRAMGIYHGNIQRTHNAVYKTDHGQASAQTVTAWSLAPAIGAVQHFIGERTFNRILFHNGLPWIMVFDGLEKNPDDGTMVVVGDIGEAFGHDRVLFRTVRGLKETERKEFILNQLETLDPFEDMITIQELMKEFNTPLALEGATMTLKNKKNLFALYDFYGNELESTNGMISIPLNHQGYFLRSNGSKNSFKKLIAAVSASRIDGYEPLETVAYDFTAPIEQDPYLRLKLTNILNRPIKGVLTLSIGELAVDNHQRVIRFAPHETKEILIRVSGQPTPDNTYPLKLTFDAQKDGKALHHEDIHVNYIAQRSILVDGKLDDWEGVAPQPIKAPGIASRSITEEAWFPFLQFDSTVSPGFSNAYLAYDDNYFYFSAKVSDDTPDTGMRRFEGGDEDYCFYPDTSYKKDLGTDFSIRWTGRIKPPLSERYTFLTNSDDGVRLWIDGELLIDNWTNHPTTIDFKSIELEADRYYDIKLDYYQHGGKGIIQLMWESNNHPRMIVPTEVLFSTSNQTHLGDGLSAELYNGTNFNALRTSRIDKFIDFAYETGQQPDPGFMNSPVNEMIWPDQVRKFSYRSRPELPSGNHPNHDNIQIAFNVLEDEDKMMYPNPPGTPRHFTNYQCSDYEYALNPIAAEYGGGTEVVRLRHPGMPQKHHFPRQPRTSLDGAVKDAWLVINHDGNTRIVEATIPWTEIPHVKARLDNGQTIKFSYRVNDDTDRGCMELSRNRSVAKRNGSFQVDWKEHWANELEFGFER